MPKTTKSEDELQNSTKSNLITRGRPLQGINLRQSKGDNKLAVERNSDGGAHKELHFRAEIFSAPAVVAESARAFHLFHPMMFSTWNEKQETNHLQV